MICDEHIRYSGHSERAKFCVRFTGSVLAEAVEVTGAPLLQPDFTPDADWGALQVGIAFPRE